MNIKRMSIIVVSGILTYFIGIKVCDEVSSKIFDRPSIFRSTDLIYINPYASQKTKSIYRKNKIEEEMIKERKNNPLLQQRQDWGEWSYEIDSEIHKDKYKEEFLLLANTAREFKKMEASRFNDEVKEKGDSIKVIDNLEDLRKKSIVQESSNKENINKYIDILIEESNKAINSKEQSKLDLMTEILENFALRYEDIINGKEIDEDIIRLY